MVKLIVGIALGIHLIAAPANLVAASTCCDLLLAHLTLLVHEQRTEDEGASLAVTTTTLCLADCRN